MRRIITSLKKVNKDVLNALLKEYPNGIDDAEFVNFPTAGGGFLRALEFELDDCLYLIKMDDEEYYLRFHSKGDDDDDDDDDDNDDDSGDDDVDGVEDLDDVDEDIDD